MRTYVDCVPCFIRQAIDAARRVTDKSAVHEELLRETLRAAGEMSFDRPPPEMGQIIHRTLRKLSGETDPYRQAKQQANKFALSLYPDLKEIVSRSPCPFTAAVKLAIAGNVIDLGVKSGLTEEEIRAAIGESLEARIDLAEVEGLQSAIRAAGDILYLADNAGEIVFDRLLIEQMPRQKITVVVKGGPIINDATREDAQMAGLAQIVNVIDNGVDVPGTSLALCSNGFRRRFEAADLIIAKGQGNYETLSDVRRRIFFLLKAKCAVVARDLGCEVGELVIRRGAA